MQQKVCIAGIKMLLRSEGNINTYGLEIFNAEFENADLIYNINLMDYELYNSVCAAPLICEYQESKIYSLGEKLACVILHNPESPYMAIFNPLSPQFTDIYVWDALMLRANITELFMISTKLMQFNGFMLHSSLINYNNMGVLFSAPSGTGKSTQAELWKKYQNAEILNGDRAVLRKTEGVWQGYGSPWSGSSCIMLQKQVPIKAFVVIRQAPQNRVVPLGKAAAFKAAVSESLLPMWNDVCLNKTLSIIEQFVCDVNSYMLLCRPDEEAVQIVKQLLLNNE